MRKLVLIGLRLLLLPVLILGFVLVMTIFVLYQVRDLDPAGWDRGVVEWLGWEAVTGLGRYALSTAEAEVAIKAGLNPELVTRATLAEKWADEQWGPGSGDRALYIALTQGETANCRDAGQGLAAQELRKRFEEEVASKQIAALETLLEIWQRNDIRSNPSSRSSDYLMADYSLESVKGSTGAGALGCSQFLPGTALPHLQIVGEPFDLWEPQTAMIVMAAELHRLGWTKDANFLTKGDIMAGWNQNRVWGASIVGKAEAYRTYLGTRSGLEEIGWLGEMPWWKSWMATGLQLTGLLPDVSRSFALPNDQNIEPWQRKLANAGIWQMPVAKPVFVRGCGEHEVTSETCGWDLSVPLSTPIFPAQVGKVTQARCGYNDGYGCFVLIDHGSGIQTRYAHLLTDSLAVEVGDEVGLTTLLGRVGLTGKTTGPHLHLETILDGAAVDSTLVLGSFAEFIEKEEETK